MKPSFSLRRVAIGLWLALIPLLIVMLNSAVSSRRLRIGILFVAAALIAGGLVFANRHKRVFFSATAILASIALFLNLPGRPFSKASLEQRYLADMASFDGAPYVWGGESRQGIDCSGLLRRSWQDALLKEGLLTLNPALVRAALDLWWNDTTAQQIGQGYGGRTTPVTKCPSLNTLNHSLLQPGDMAVTASGGHMLGYLGDNKWIEADPLALKVLTFSVPEKTSAWFTTPMTIVRWRPLSL